MDFSLTSPSFSNLGIIPKKHSRLGDNSSPELIWKNPPESTKSFALAIVDPDAPGGDFIHWVIYNIPPESHSLSSEMVQDPILENGTMQGINDFGTVGYGGPCPPPPKTHAYVFTLYALDSILPLGPKAFYDELHDAMKDHILSQVSLTGYFTKESPV